MYLISTETKDMRIMEQTRRYPIGVQTFEKIREGGFLYIDKTALVYDLVTSNAGSGRVSW